ncbi:phage NrS-1 polymerase family protein [Halobaculum sp. EA56]|uniref:phage NrS-1 polymerase family protein n=1 Tax=Halobaculum sp. EA56 TaxID=3421648 RepID=UPI003EBE8FEF
MDESTESGESKETHRSEPPFPPELVTCEQWVGWRTQTRGENKTKVPLNPDDGRFAAVDDPETWGDLDAAQARSEFESVDGVGFVFTEDDPFVGIDLDDCRDPETGELDDRAEAIVETLDSYTEVSPSGTGVHVIVRGRLPDGRSRRGHVEMYDAARFFTMTGERVDGTPRTAEARIDELASVHAEYVAVEERSEDANDDGPYESGENADDGPTEVIYDDEELLKRARSAKNGKKFSRLWRGDTSGYDSQSEADMALCALLAFWTGCEEARIDRLFRSSGLYRDKWDERHFADGSTYGEKTIERAVAGTTETYSPPSGEAPVEESREECTERSQHLSVITELEGRVTELAAENTRLKSELQQVRAERDALSTSNVSPDDAHSNRSVWDHFLALFKLRESS